MLPEDDQPKVHEIGNRTYIVADVEPLDLDGVRTIQVGTALWGIALVVMVVFRAELERDGRCWWLWTLPPASPRVRRLEHATAHAARQAQGDS